MNTHKLNTAQENTLRAVQQFNGLAQYPVIKALGGNGASLSFLVREELLEEVTVYDDGDVFGVRMWRLK